MASHEPASVCSMFSMQWKIALPNTASKLSAEPKNSVMKSYSHETESRSTVDTAR